MKTFKYLVKGKVQGVGYRFYVGPKLKFIGGKGYIKNLYDGDVEIVIQIDEKKIQKVENFIQKGSPKSISI